MERNGGSVDGAINEGVSFTGNIFFDDNVSCKRSWARENIILGPWFLHLDNGGFLVSLGGVTISHADSGASI